MVGHALLILMEVLPLALAIPVPCDAADGECSALPDGTSALQVKKDRPASVLGSHTVHNGGKAHDDDYYHDYHHDDDYSHHPTMQAKLIRHRHGNCLDASERYNNGGNVHMWACDSSNLNQLWLLNPATGQIKARHGKCLDASGRNRNGGNVHMWDCDTSNWNQQWLYLSTGQIKARHGICLDAFEGGSNCGEVHMWNCDSGNQNQQWRIYSVGANIDGEKASQPLDTATAVFNSTLPDASAERHN